MNLKEYLFEQNPFDGLDLEGFEYNPAPFNLPLSVLDMVKDLSPFNIIEVGSWKGASAIHMADQLRDYKIPGQILCIDTWLGAEEMWFKPDREQFGRYSGLNLKNGYPSFYFDFLRNVLFAGHQDRITPFPTTSQIAASLLSKLDFKADMIYIDGSHTYEDVLADLRAYWKLLRGRGIIMGDDYCEWWGVKRAVEEFSVEIGVPFEVFHDLGWVMRKTDPQKIL
jgi:hypothetical protein